jgi:hypothetical protein
MICQIGAAATPSADLIQSITAASGGMDAFSAIGVIQMEINEKDSFADGTSQSTDYTLVLDTTLDSIRLEMGDGQIVIVSNGDTGWALVRGALDERRQTSHMAPKIIRKKVMPWLLPFTLTLKGVYFPRAPSETAYEGEPALKAAFTVPSTFFDTPVMNTNWTVFMANEDHRILAAEFPPNPDFREAKKEGMHYRLTKTTEIKGVRIPAEIKVTGIDDEGKKTKTTRIITITTSIVKDPSPALFLHPDKLRAFEEDE